MPKAKTKGSKKRDGGSNGNLNGKSAKETMLLEMRVRSPFIISSFTVYMNVSEVRALPRLDMQSAVYHQKKFYHRFP